MFDDVFSQLYKFKSWIIDVIDDDDEEEEEEEDDDDISDTESEGQDK